MKDYFAVLIGDTESGEWSLSVLTPDCELATQEYNDLKDINTPAILIATSDFVTV